ncbi:MAG: hypothetical protein ABSD77_08295 [Verrucomicrobiota bacterium]
MSEYMKQEEEFLDALDRDIGWQWRWEKKWRFWMMFNHWSGWLLRLLLLAFTTFQLSVFGIQQPPLWLPFTLTTLALLNLALPQLASAFKFQQRQEIYDWHARCYSAIRVQFVTGQIDLKTAVAKYTEVSQKPTESVIRGTP